MGQSNRRTVRCRADEIDRLRQARGLSLEALASKAGVNLRTLQRWLAGQEAFIANVDAVAAALKVQPEEIIDRITQDSSSGCPDNTSRFTLGMTFEGSLTSLGQAKQIAEVSRSAVAELQRLGITVDRAEASILITQNDCETTRIISVVYGLLTDEAPCWIYVAVRPSMYNAFEEACKQKSDIMRKFAPFGEIIVSGHGTEPPSCITRRVGELYSSPGLIALAAAEERAASGGANTD